MNHPYKEAEMGNPSTTLKESIARQRKDLSEKLDGPMEKTASRCSAVWPDRKELDHILEGRIRKINHCKFLYALNTKGIQVCDNISREGIIKDDFGRDRSKRPYMQQLPPDTCFNLSEAYISLRGNLPSLTALHCVRDKDGTLLGYIGADFDLRDMPMTKAIYEDPKAWLQIKGDPSIRSGVFEQQRIESQLDQNLDTVFGILTELMVDHGVFHVMLHFSSSRAVVWHYDDPYRYKLLGIDSLTDPDICLAFPKHRYPKDALIPSNRIPEIWEAFRQLRFIDEMLYLRTGTINIFNGIIALTFSCDGSHYIPWEEFLDKEHVLWADKKIV